MMIGAFNPMYALKSVEYETSGVTVYLYMREPLY